VLVEQRVLRAEQTGHPDDQGKPGHEDGCHIVDGASGAAANALQADGDGEQRCHLHAELGQAPFRHMVDVAAADVVADFERHRQHGEQDAGGIEHAGGDIVSAPSQQVRAGPEADGGDAVAPQQPIEYRRGADVRDDPRLPENARTHERGSARREPAQHRKRTLVGNHGGTRRHQRQRDGQPALLEREREGERETGDRTDGEQRLRGSGARPRLTFVQGLGRHRIKRRQNECDPRERNRALEAGNPVVQCDQHRDRRQYR
jgi:hypothetical protein